MRYLIAIVCAAIAAVIAIMFTSNRIATALTDLMTFNSPDQNDNWHDTIFIGANLVALLIGWGIGWVLGSRFEGRDEAPSKI